jgi:hypothetical protein
MEYYFDILSEKQIFVIARSASEPTPPKYSSIDPFYYNYQLADNNQKMLTIRLRRLDEAIFNIKEIAASPAKVLAPRNDTRRVYAFSGILGYNQIYATNNFSIRIPAPKSPYVAFGFAV